MPQTDSTAAAEIARGERFAFGANWSSFLGTLDEGRIRIAEDSLRGLLGVENLAGRTFLDVGSGSGLFSLAARRLGARVRSFDFDPQSVACTRELQQRYCADDPEWTVTPGSALDETFLASLGTFDVVYSWGVLHHTGQMWRAIELVSQRVSPGGLFVLALYNDQGWRSRAWRVVKQCYCAGPFGRGLMTAIFFPWFFARAMLVSLIRGRNEFADYRRKRGMSITHDWIDWLGGLPFEVATPDAVEGFLQPGGFVLQKLNATRRLGCNEFVFTRP